MGEDDRNSKSLEVEVFQLIRDYVAQRDPRGFRYIKSYEKELGADNETEKTQELEQYLSELLANDNRLRNELNSAFGDNNQFTTIVAGGQVEKIINIAKAGAVHIHEHKTLITHRSFVMLLAVIGIVLFSASSIYWLSKQPRNLKGQFNVAVATFDVVSDIDDPIVAQNISKEIFNIIDREYNSQDNNLDVDVEHKNIGVIYSENDAINLAKKISAHIVIYGTITITDDTFSISPRFYIVDSFVSDAGELVGSHYLEKEEDFYVGDWNNNELQEQVKQELQQRSGVLISFTKGLTYLALSETEETGRSAFLRLALESFQQAIGEAEEKGSVNTEAEVLYLFASHVSLLQGNLNSAQAFLDDALALDKCYGRAYIAQGNIYYDLGVQALLENNDIYHDYFDLAISSNEYALELDTNSSDCGGQPYSYYLSAKANNNLGNIHSVLFQSESYVGNSNLAEKALAYFDSVINAYDDLPKNDPGKDNIRKLAVNALYQSGVVLLNQDKYEPAIEKFTRVIELADACAPLAIKAQGQLERLGQPIEVTCEGYDE